MPKKHLIKYDFLNFRVIEVLIFIEESSVKMNCSFENCPKWKLQRIRESTSLLSCHLDVIIFDLGALGSSE